MGFSDHFPQYFLPMAHRDPRWAVPTMAGFREYIRAVQELQRETAQPEILIGVEVDYRPGWCERVRSLLRPFPLDYVIGSVHQIGDWAFDILADDEEYSRRDIADIYEEYFHIVCQAATSGLFDIIGHCDLIKKFGYRLPNGLAGHAERFAAACRAGGVAVEINTSGLRYPVQEVFPAQIILSALFAQNVPITFGSDAHRPEDVGRDLELAMHMAREAGYKKIATFRRRRREMVSWHD
jgi:histidinol-phosphatase (PHP family)